jgi:hypothetical protein
MNQDDDLELPEIPIPDDRVGNIIALVMFWVMILGLAVPAWAIGAPWGWFAYTASILLLFGLMELRQLNNILVRTLPALRLLLVETKRLRQLQEDRDTTTKR